MQEAAVIHFHLLAVSDNLQAAVVSRSFCDVLETEHDVVGKY